MTASDRLLHDVLPAFAEELEESLREEYPDLAEQVHGLRITSVCGCGDDFCSSFYTGPKPTGAWGPEHVSVVPEVKDGMVILDVVGGSIRYVEVLFRRDVRAALFSTDLPDDPMAAANGD